MSDHSAMQRDVAERQVAMFASFVGRGCYITRAALSAASRIPESTLREWAAGAAMPLSGVLTLRKHLPGDAINLLTEPGDARLVGIETEQGDWDDVAAEAAGLTFEICEARKDGVIDHREKARLRSRGRQVIARLSDAIADD